MSDSPPVAQSKLSLSVLTAILQVNPGQPVFTEAKDDGSGGDNRCHKSLKAPVRSSPPTNQQKTFCRPDALPVAKPSVKALKEKRTTSYTFTKIKRQLK